MRITSILIKMITTTKVILNLNIDRDQRGKTIHLSLDRKTHTIRKCART